jgi:subtilisin family serine protease
MQRQLTVISMALLCVAAVSAAQLPGQAPRSLDQVLSDVRTARALHAHHGKISSRLLPPLTVGPMASGLVAAPPPLAADGSLHVYLDCSPLGTNELRKLEQVGARIERIHMARGLVQAWVDPSTLDTLAGFSWVRVIRRADPAIVRSGGVTTQGDAASRADVLRTAGLDGTGVVVGVISDGTDNLADAQATNDLPDVVVPNDSRCQRGAGNEGTALLEIVHDVAPGAKLLFSGPSTSLDMVDTVQCLADAGADVIVDDLGFFGEPYFEDGPVADAVSAAVTAGVSYHSSAGNEAQEHVEQDFFPTSGSNGEAHDWAAGAGDVFNGVVVPARGTLTCILQWNDPFGAAADDYDLALLDANLRLVAESVDPQEGAQDPIEVVQVVNQTNTNQLANILVNRFAGAPRRLEVFCLGAAAIEHGSAAGSIFGHAGLPSVVAVGAVDVHDPGLDTVEPFSSHGPARIDFPTPELRAKPDLVAFDGVAISNAGGFPACPPFCAFFGTSAAAPHSAGVAALLLDQDPTLTPAEVKAALTRGAGDVGAPGFDDASGFGRLDAVAAADTLTGILGDCQIENAVNLFDILKMIDIVLGRVTASSQQQMLCDTTCNGTIDVFDILREIDAVGGRIPMPLTCPAALTAVTAEAADGPPAPDASQASGDSNAMGKVTVSQRRRSIQLQNTGLPVRGLELTFTPEGGPVEMLGVRVTSRSRQLRADFYQTSPDEPVKVVLVSLDGRAIAPGRGSVARLQMRAAGGRLKLTEAKVAP